ncbi:MAG: VF530 family DNA-binding protein [Wohlfahrtiimonas sp.]
MQHTSNDPLHGKKLANIIEELVDYYDGFEALGEQINIRCFTHDPSVKSSLKFLRQTPWAREKVESLYLYVQNRKLEDDEEE